MGNYTDQIHNLTNSAFGLRDEHGDMWHGHDIFAGSVPVETALNVLRINAVKLPLTYQVPFGPDGDTVTMPVMKGDDPLYGIFDGDTGHCFNAGVTDSYQIHVYEELLDLLCALLDQGAHDVKIGGVAAWGHKQQAMIQVRPAEGVTVGGDKILPWLAAYSSLDSTLATGVKACRTRFQCWNTGRMILGEKNPTYKIKHTRNSQARIAQAREIVGIMFESIPAMVAEIDRFQNVTLTDAQFSRVVDKLFPLVDAAGQPLVKNSRTIAEGKRDTLAGMWKNDPRVRDYTGTVWGAIQTVNTAVTHEFTVRGAAKGITRTDRQAQNTVTGKIDTVDAETIRAINEVFAGMGVPTRV